MPIVSALRVMLLNPLVGNKKEPVSAGALFVRSFVVMGFDVYPV